MTTDIDTALAGTEPALESARSLVAPVRPCRRHAWTTWVSAAGETIVHGTACARCGKVRDEALSRRGRNARLKGNAYELELARRLGGEKVGHHGGPEDVRQGMFNAQAKVRAGTKFPGWMADELRKLPRTGGRTPILVVADSPGPGHRRRALVIVELDDWIALHGEEAGGDLS